jgi:uncharacterized membrane protein YdbT with pleckstrin-like domain
MKTNELPLWTAKPSQLINLGWFIFSMIPLIAFILDFGWIMKYLLPLPITLSLIRAVITACNRYTLSSERFVHSRGVFSRVINALELYRVQDYAVHMPFFLRIFGLSNVILFTSDRSTPVVVIKGVRNGWKVANTIRNQVESMRMQKGVLEVS